MLAVLPFWTSYVVRSYCWLLVLAPNGVVLGTLRGLGLDPRRPAGQHAHRHGHRLRPFLRHAADPDDLRQPRADPGQLPAAAADLGASAWQAFLRDASCR